MAHALWLTALTTQDDTHARLSDRRPTMLGKLTVALVACAFVGVTTWIAKLQIKRQMESKLGRKVDDAELTSITGWMKAHEKAEKDRTPSSSD